MVRAWHLQLEGQGQISAQLQTVWGSLYLWFHFLHVSDPKSACFLGNPSICWLNIKSSDFLVMFFKCKLFIFKVISYGLKIIMSPSNNTNYSKAQTIHTKYNIMYTNIRTIFTTACHKVCLSLKNSFLSADSRCWLIYPRILESLLKWYDNT